MNNAAAMTRETRRLSHQELIDWLRLIRSENVGPVTFFKLIERFGTAAAALEALPTLARRGGREKPIRICTKAAVVRELADAEKCGARPVCAIEGEFPALLPLTEGSPPVLYVRGDARLFTKPCIGIVGARNASASGRQFARKLAAELGHAGVTVVSGLARGLDTAAHEGSLETGTVAVVAGGVDVIYPPENRGLHEEIAARGAVVSEMPPGTEPQARHFPRRNRIISGMSLGIVVVEATARSGSLITARFALEQDREVFAVPGSPLDARAEGPNGLIRDGAMLIRGAGDILDALRDIRHRPLGERPSIAYGSAPPAFLNDKDLAAARRRVSESLGYTAVMVDEIIRQCQLSPAVVSVILLELELAGRLERHPGNRVSLMPDP